MLTFIHGVMGCGKSAQIIDYCEEHPDTACFKLKFELENPDKITSRNGKSIPCINFYHDTDLQKLIHTNNAKNIIVDEVQFCTVEQINQLANIAHDHEIFCYGLLFDNCGDLFPASKQLLLVCNHQHEIERNCVICNHHKANISARFTVEDDFLYKNNKEWKTIYPVLASKYVKYLSLCWHCWTRLTMLPARQADFEYWVNHEEGDEHENNM